MSPRPPPSESEGVDLERALSVVVVVTPPGYVLGWLVANALDAAAIVVWLVLVGAQAVAVAVLVARADESSRP